MSGQTVPAPGEPRKRAARAPWAALGLRWRLTISLGVALLVLLIGFTLFSLQGVNRAQRQALSQQLHLARAMAGGLERELEHLGTDVRIHLSLVPSPTTLMEALTSLQDHLVNRENLGYFQVTGVRLVNAQGEFVVAAHPDTPSYPETLPLPEVIQQAVSQGHTLVTPSRLLTDGGVPFAAVVVPMSPSPGSPQGAALVVDTMGLAGIALFSSSREAAPEHGAETQSSGSLYEVEVLGSDGAVLATSGRDAALGTESRHYAAMKEYLARGEASAIIHRLGVRGFPDHIVAIVPLAGTPFFLVAEEPLGLLLDWPRQVRNQAIILGGAAVLIILVLGWIAGQQLVRPIAALRRAAGRIGEGDLDTPIRIGAPGELARLVEEVEAMRQRLQDTVSSLDGLNRSLEDQVQERTQQLRTVVARLMQAQEEERRRVARDLHDETAQGLTALGVMLDEAALDAEERGEQAPTSIRYAREQVRRLVAETRRLAYALRPSVLDDAGLIPALRWCAEAYLESSGVQVSLEASEPELRLPEPVEVALFRIGQEAMSNIAKHARASHVWVTLERHGAWATLTVRDDGVGFDAGLMMEKAGPPQGRGLGLAGMRERIDLLGGRFHVSSQPGEGTTVTAYVPTGRWDGEKS